MSIMIAGAVSECESCRNFSVIPVEKYKYLGIFGKTVEYSCRVCENKQLKREKKLTELGI